MLRRHGHLACYLLLALGVVPGCTSVGIKNGIPYIGKQQQWEPEDEPDKWANVGREGRGTRQLEDENDPLKRMLMSKEAQDIERNLGYK